LSDYVLRFVSRLQIQTSYREWFVPAKKIKRFKALDSFDPRIKPISNSLHHRCCLIPRKALGAVSDRIFQKNKLYKTYFFVY
jgi:hypothetical protein